jgi:hypothetical protein
MISTNEQVAASQMGLLSHFTLLMCSILKIRAFLLTDQFIVRRIERPMRASKANTMRWASSIHRGRAMSGRR